jgi:hypothetical protein
MGIAAAIIGVVVYAIGKRVDRKQAAA